MDKTFYQRHDFWRSIPDDCEKAINELKRLKVFRLCAFDYEETFADVWWLVLHEVDMYAEGEFCRESSRSCYNYGEPEAMNLKQAQSADKWLCRWLDLFNKYKGNECHTEYYLTHVSSGFDERYFYYGGQVI